MYPTLVPALYCRFFAGCLDEWTVRECATVALETGIDVLLVEVISDAIYDYARTLYVLVLARVTKVHVRIASWSSKSKKKIF